MVDVTHRRYPGGYTIRIGTVYNSRRGEGASTHADPAGPQAVSRSTQWTD